MDPLLFFGIGVALVGLGGVGTAWHACREVLAIPFTDGSMLDRSLLGAMLFILLVDIGIVAAGLWIALVVAGGAHG